jgi:IclR family transcriptional regulator, acetate operon repressor
MDTIASGTAVQLSRPVIGSAFALLASLHKLGSARVSELQRDCGLPRTTVHRLLGQLQDVGAVERSDGRWRIGPALLELGSRIPAEPRLRSVARRPLMDLARATGGLVALSVEMAGRGLVIEVFPSARPIPLEPHSGMALDKDKIAAAGLQVERIAALRAQEAAHRGDLRLVIDAGGTDPRVSCVAAPLRLSRHDTGAVWLMVPGGDGVADAAMTATRRTAGKIATELSKPSLPGPAALRIRRAAKEAPSPREHLLHMRRS